MAHWIVFQDDFGPDNIGTAAMKGAAVSVDSDLRIADLTSSIEPFNIWQASDSLMYAEPFWPKGTVFVSVVDPGVGTGRRAAVAKLKDGKYVVTPDNGTLTHLAAEVGVAEIRQVDETRNRLQSTLKTSVFHGRDLFAYCGARLAAGIISFEEVGPAYPVDEIVKLKRPLSASVTEDGLEGEITSISRFFGNIFTNIAVRDLEQNGFEKGKSYRLVIWNEHGTAYDSETPYVTSFGNVAHGSPLFFNGSTLYLCIACNQESFAEKFHVSSAERWKVKLYR